MKRIILLFAIFIILNIQSLTAQSLYNNQESQLFVKPFVHPGIAQNTSDLEYMKHQVNAGVEPWKTAFENLKKKISLDFRPIAHTHISVGPYGVNDNGGKDLFSSANAAYNCAIMWYITNDKIYAKKAIEIINAWSSVLWDFDDNNAKLSVGLTAYYFLNAAEILKYTSSGWQKADIQQFKRMIMTVYYPTIKDFFTEANGNWDASIINSLLCIGIFTDNHQIFNKALNRYYYGPGNSGITKYIYPNGQLQEATRDWGHVQLGIGEFAKAAQVAWTQGVDLYSAANNRLALGYEYTAKYLSGEKVPIYGTISTRETTQFRDIYESVYYHYRTVKGLDMPYTEKIISKHTRFESAEMLLTAYRAPAKNVHKIKGVVSVVDTISAINSLVGALAQSSVNLPSNVYRLAPGDSIQMILDRLALNGGTIVLLKGVHYVTSPLRIPSNVTLIGQGNETILSLKPYLTGKTIINQSPDMHDVTIRDILIEGANSTVVSADPNNERRLRSYMNATSREGIVFSSDYGAKLQNICLTNVTVQNFTKNGVSIKGATGIKVEYCNFSDNGSSVVPGAGFHHNLCLSHVKDCKISNSRFDTSPWGSGIDVSFGQDLSIINNELARNKLSGLRCSECNKILISGNIAEGNDGNGILLDKIMDGCIKVTLNKNIARNNGLYGIWPNSAENLEKNKNILFDNLYK